MISSGRKYVFDEADWLSLIGMRGLCVVLCSE